MSKLIPDFEEVSPYEEGTYPRDYHGTVSVQLCELIDGGWVKWYSTMPDGTVLPNPDWKWDYYDLAQYKRLCDKIDARYMFDEISLMPPLVWKQQLIRKLNEVMPKYKPLYKLLENGASPIQESARYGKSRQIYSEFPETLLNGNSDYVSNGSDREYEDIIDGSWLDKVLQLARDYQDIDALVLDELEPLFSSLYTVAVNGY